MADNQTQAQAQPAHNPNLDLNPDSFQAPKVAFTEKQQQEKAATRAAIAEGNVAYFQQKGAEINQELARLEKAVNKSTSPGLGPTAQSYNQMLIERDKNNKNMRAAQQSADRQASQAARLEATRGEALSEKEKAFSKFQTNFAAEGGDPAQARPLFEKQWQEQAASTAMKKPAKFGVRLPPNIRL